MVAPKQIKAYIRDASGQLTPLPADSVVLEFPSGDSLEVAWDAQHPDAPYPVCAQIWGGRRVTEAMTEAEINARTHATSVALLPSAANLVLVHPCSYAVRKPEPNG